MPIVQGRNFFQGGDNRPRRRRQRQNFLAQALQAGGGAESLRISQLKSLEFKSLAEELERENARRLWRYQNLVSSPEDFSDDYDAKVLSEVESFVDNKVSAYKPENELDAEVVKKLRNDMVESFKFEIDGYKAQLKAKQKAERKRQGDDADSTRVFGRVQREMMRAEESALAGIDEALESWQDAGSQGEPDLIGVIDSTYGGYIENIESLKGSMQEDEYARAVEGFKTGLERIKSKARVASSEAGRQAHNSYVLAAAGETLGAASTPEELTAIREDIDDTVRSLQGVDNLEQKKQLQERWQRAADSKALNAFNEDPFGYDFSSWSGVASEDVLARIANATVDAKLKKAESYVAAASRGLSTSERRGGDLDSVILGRRDVINRAREALNDPDVVRHMDGGARLIELARVSDAEASIEAEVAAQETFTAKLGLPHLGALNTVEQRWANNHFASVVDNLPDDPGERQAAVVRMVTQTAGLDVPAVRDYIQSLGYSGIVGSSGSEAGVGSIEELSAVIKAVGGRNANVVYDMLPGSVQSQVRDYVRLRSTGGDTVTPAMALSHVTKRDRDHVAQARLDGFSMMYPDNAKGYQDWNASATKVLNEVLGTDYSEDNPIDPAVLGELRTYTELAIGRDGLDPESAARSAARQLTRSGMGVDPESGRIVTDSPRTLFSRKTDTTGLEYKMRLSYSMHNHGADWDKPFDESELRVVGFTDNGVRKIAFRKLNEDGTPGELLTNKSGVMLAIPQDRVLSEGDEWIQKNQSLIYGSKGFKGLFRLEEEANRLRAEGVGTSSGEKIRNMWGFWRNTGKSDELIDKEHRLAELQELIKERENQIYRHQGWIRNTRPSYVDDSPRIYHEPSDTFKWWLNAFYGDTTKIGLGSYRGIELKPESRMAEGGYTPPGSALESIRGAQALPE